MPPSNMQPGNPITDQNDTGQSFRQACERCRAHKLRCTRKEDSASGYTCQRCARARVQCVFSPRSRGSRNSRPAVSRTDGKHLSLNDRSDQRCRIPATDSSVDPISPLETQMPSPPRDIFGQETTSPKEYTNHQWIRHDSSDQCSVIAQSFYSYHDGFTMNPDSFDRSFDDTDMMQDLSQDPKKDSNHLRLLIEKNTRTPTSTQDRDLLVDIPMTTSGQSQKFTPPTCGPPAYTEFTSSGHRKDTSTHRLIVLAERLNHQLHLLTSEPWAKDTHPPDLAMSGYPIGDILHQSHELSDILLTLSWNQNLGCVEVPVALLALNCYVCLIRIYRVTFSHLSQHLQRAPLHPSPEATSHLLAGVVFEELQPPGTSWQKAYTAFHMLFDALECIEKALGLPGEFRITHLGISVSASQTQETTTSERRTSVFEADTRFNNDHCTSISNSDGENKDGKTDTPHSGLLDFRLVEAVLKQEDLTGGVRGESGLSLLHDQVEQVKKQLRHKMKLQTFRGTNG